MLGRLCHVTGHRHSSIFTVTWILVTVHFTTGSSILVLTKATVRFFLNYDSFLCLPCGILFVTSISICYNSILISSVALFPPGTDSVKQIWIFLILQCNLSCRLQDPFSWRFPFPWGLMILLELFLTVPVAEAAPLPLPTSRAAPWTVKEAGSVAISHPPPFLSLLWPHSIQGLAPRLLSPHSLPLYLDLTVC